MTRILIVEDIIDNVELIRKALSQTGFELLHAPDAETGLAMALEQPPNLILLDLGLPDYDGQTLAGWLRDEPSLNNTPIVVMTAWPEEAARQVVTSYKCDGYISKPIVKISEFIAEINSYLKAS
jgi:DNA-binding response OmpR family regulator